ncbi:sugar ABC transporter substrate-binding protein [Reyranella aquatilis]|uniref:Sugar ABC transporter substrate-binding protein n=1 Tax=Reyranella aquatilis TaxID=2035356 RepID=A0ABS8KSN1_9HYPH|nr:sugar ABC transporter substrate-binding protein [Reyranella aquatilis]MCC8429085.1 sugar ABC transporter substrate-binding protein [Reyranella aquatilis]
MRSLPTRPPILAVFTKNRVNPAYDAARLAVDRVAAQAGALTAHYVPATPDHVGEQKALVAEALAGRPDAVLFNPTDDVAMVEDVARITAAGIPVGVFINRMAVPVVTFVGSDDIRVGETIARALFRGLGGTGKIVALDGTPGARTARDRTEGLKRALADHPGIELVGSRVGYLQEAPARTAMAGLLRAHPRIDGVWTANDVMAFGALKALEEAGRTATVVGINGLPAAIDHIERGTMLASVDFSAFNIASIAAQAVLRHLAGQPVPGEIMVPAELIERSNCHRWKVPFERRPIPNWTDFVR